MRSSKTDLRMPHALKEAAKKRAEATGMRNFPRYLIGLVIQDLLQEPREETYRMIANADPDEQDELIRFVISFPKNREEIRKRMIAALPSLAPPPPRPSTSTWTQPRRIIK